MKKAILLLNIGSPDSTETKDVRAYLKDFLMDPYVLDIPKWLRTIIVYGLILPFRPKKSAEAYKSIWLKQGSPLIVYSSELAEKLEDQLNCPVESAMRYGNIDQIQNQITELMSTNGGEFEQIHLVPMFPQYARATTTGIIAYTTRIINELAPKTKITIQPPFYKTPEFINTLKELTEPYLNTPKDKLLLSYHGLPERQLKKTDPTGEHCLKTPNCCEIPSSAHPTCYRHQCFETTKALIKALNIPEEKVITTFQSRLGNDPWLKPATDETLILLAKQGVKHLKVLCPAFTTDCLETLEEIGIEGKETFLENGGETYTLIPCPNANDNWANALASLIKDKA